MPSFELPDLAGELRRLLDQVAPGTVTTYGDLARALGDVRAARWVGEFLAHDHAHTQTCPCHRVIRSTGEVGLYVSGHPIEKAHRLKAEGVIVRNDRVDLRQVQRPADFESASPLTQLIDFQNDVHRRLTLRPLAEPPQFFCGLDAAYLRNGVTVGAAVVLSAKGLDVLREFTCQRPVSFPYIPGYLAFRELPILLDLWTQVSREFPSDIVCFVDGNGMLHPRQAGVASCFGVEADVPTIGLGKSLLCGRVMAETHDDPASRFLHRDIVLHDTVIGRAVHRRQTGLRPSGRSTEHPVYVSVGNHLTLTDAVWLTEQTWTTHSLPEPTYLADRLSKRAKRM